MTKEGRLARLPVAEELPVRRPPPSIENVAAPNVRARAMLQGGCDGVIGSVSLSVPRADVCTTNCTPIGYS